MKEVVRKLSPEHKSAVSVDGRHGGVRTGTKTKSPPVYRGDLMTKDRDLFYLFWAHKL